jgi:hypothetical protein
VAAFWVLAVLRPFRLYGTVTFLRQGWTTRSQIEVHAELATKLPLMEKAG